MKIKKQGNFVKMSKEKYFSVDVSNDIHILKLHETLEEAKQSCLNNATDAFEFADELDEYENYEHNDLPYAVYGLILGRAKSDKRPLTDEERESGYYMAHISHIIEPPKLVEVNGWISVKDKLPETKTRFDLIKMSDTVLVFGKDEEGDPNHIFTAYMAGNGIFYASNGKCHEVTHWHLLPEPPQENAKGQVFIDEARGIV